eukprot:1146645-Pelagomonas_calceolata.AAC.4
MPGNQLCCALGSPVITTHHHQRPSYLRSTATSQHINAGTADNFLAFPRRELLLVQKSCGSNANGGERRCWGALDVALELWSNSWGFAKKWRLQVSTAVPGFDGATCCQKKDAHSRWKSIECRALGEQGDEEYRQRVPTAVPGFDGATCQQGGDEYPQRKKVEDRWQALTAAPGLDGTPCLTIRDAGSLSKRALGPGAGRQEAQAAGGCLHYFRLAWCHLPFH